MHTKPCTNHIKQRANEEHYRLDSLCRQLKPVMVAIELPGQYTVSMFGVRAYMYTCNGSECNYDGLCRDIELSMNSVRE